MRLILSVLVFCVFLSLAFGGTTGKITGTVSDSRTGEKLVAANVVVEGTSLGASTNVEGYYVILNVPSGRYRVKASLVGYTPTTLVDVRVEIDQTTTGNFRLNEETVEAQEVIVVAQRPVVQRDVAASRANIEAVEVQKLPVATVNSVVALQAGIQSSNLGPVIRGSTADQTVFMVDGMTLRDSRTNNPYTGITLTSIQDIQIQTGGFSAEYGDLRAGVVNVVTREGSPSKYSFGFTTRYAPARPKHFGPSAYDKNSYWIRPYVDPAVAWTGTANGAWDEWTQKQYPSWGGWNQFSQNTLKDANPANDLTPAAAQQLFLWEYRRQTEIFDPDYDVDLGLGGPFPFLENQLGNLRFFFSYRQSQSAYLVPLSRDNYREYNGQLKVTSDIASGMKLTLSGLIGRNTGTNDNNAGNPGVFKSAADIASVMTRVSYIDARIFATDYWAPTENNYNSFGAKLSHALSASTFYDATIQMFKSSTETNPGRWRDTSRVYLFGNSYYVDEAPFGFQPAPSTGITGLRMGVGFSNSRDTSSVVSWTAKFDITSQLDKYNQLKSGFEFSYTDLNVRSASVDVFLPSGRYRTAMHNYPVKGALYLLDKLEFEGMVANIGIRADYLNPNGDWYVYDPYNAALSAGNSLGMDTLLQKQPIKKQLVFSPRVGISFPITDYAKLFFNYGHNRQIPDPRSIFLVRRFSDNNQVTTIADPNLSLAKTVAYELGYEHSLFDEYLIRATAYYKDVSDELLLVTYTSRDAKEDYDRYTSNRYRDIRGFELTLQKNRGNWFQGFVNYTYDVRTTGIFGWDQYYQSPTDQTNYEILNYTRLYQSKPLPRPYARLNLDLFTPENFGPETFGLKPLADWRVNFLAGWSSGFYFTWVGGGSVPGIQYNVQWKDYYNVDMRISKNFQVGRVNFQVFADVSNLFNIKFMNADETYPGYGFFDGPDYESYMKSLHLPGDVKGLTGYVNIPGSDRPGDYRDDGVAYQPIVGVKLYSDLSNPLNQKTQPFYYVEEQHQYYQFVNGQWQQADQTKLNQALDSKAYIDMPNFAYQTFLNPRQIFYGIRFSFDL